MEVWTYRVTLEPGGTIADAATDVTGYHVEATDGSIGKVDEATYETGRSYLVVDTGPWILGRKVMLPAGVVHGIDDEGETVFVDRTKDEIRNAPEFDESLIEDEMFRDQLGSYYEAEPGDHETDYEVRPPEETVM